MDDLATSSGRIDSAVKRLMMPSSIAFVGVSARGGAGVKMLRSAVRSGFAGPVWPVNPKLDSIEGLDCHPSLAALPGVPDCVVISVPAEATLELVVIGDKIGEPRLPEHGPADSDLMDVEVQKGPLRSAQPVGFAPCAA